MGILFENKPIVGVLIGVGMIFFIGVATLLIGVFDGVLPLVRVIVRAGDELIVWGVIAARLSKPVFLTVDGVFGVAGRLIGGLVASFGVSEK